MSESFTINAFNRVLSSNFFYATKHQEKRLHDQGSILDTLFCSNTDLSVNGKIKRHFVGEIQRTLARVIAGYVIGVFALVAVVYNTARLCRSSLKFTHTDQERIKHLDLKKALSVDAGCSAITYFSLFCTVPLLLEGLVVASLFAFVVPIVCYANVKHLAQLLLPLGNQRTAFLKAIALRKHFGLVNEKGKLLNTDNIKDNEFIKVNGQILVDQGLIGKACAKKAHEFLSIIRELQSILPNYHRMLAPFIYGPKTADIIKHLRTRLPLMKPDERKAIDIQAWEKRLKEAEENMNILWNILSDCLYAETTPFGDNAKVKMPFFILPYNVVVDYYDLSAENSKIKTPFETEFEKTLAGLTPNEGPSEEYKNFKELLRKKPKIHEIFGLKSDYTAADVRKVYKQLSKVFHSDRVPVEFNDETKIIFNFITFTQAELLKKFANPHA